MSGLSGERDLTAVLIGACVGSMTVLLFTIGILAFIYWCCFRERIRWWRKFENAAVVIGNPSTAAAAVTSSSSVPSTTRSSKGPPSGLVDSGPAPFTGVSTITSSIVPIVNGSYRNNNGQVLQHEVVNDYHTPKQLPPEVMIGTGSLADRTSAMAPIPNPILISAMKGCGLSNSQLVIKNNYGNNNNNNAGGTAERLHYKVKSNNNGQLNNGKVRPGLSLVTLPTFSHLQQQQYLPNKQQQQRLLAALASNNRRTSHQAKNLQHQSRQDGIIRVRGVSVPCEETSPSDENGGDDSQPTSSSSSAFAASAKRWSSMPAITALGDFVTRERERIQRTAAKRGQNVDQTEEVSTSWRSQYVYQQNSARPNNRRNNSRRQTTCILPSSLIMSNNNANQQTQVVTAKLTDVPGSPNFSDNRQSSSLENRQARPVNNKVEKQVGMLMMTREAQYTFTADDDEDDESSSPEFFRKPNNHVPIESPPPSVSAIVGVIPQRHLAASNAAYAVTMAAPAPAPTPTIAQKTVVQQQSSQQSSSGGEYGSHSSRISGDDSAIVVLDSAQSTSSKNGTDGEHEQPVPAPPSIADTAEITPKPVSILSKPSALKKSSMAKSQQNYNKSEDDSAAHTSPHSDDQPSEQSNGLKLDEDVVSSSMRSKIAKIRRYKQRSRTTGAGLLNMGNMRSLSVAELSRPTMKILPLTTSEEAPDGVTTNQQRMPLQSQIQPRRITGDVSFAYSPTSATITGHTIGVHVDNSVNGRPIVAAISPNSGMRRYATMETLMERNDSSTGTYMGRMATSAVTASIVNTNNGHISSNNSEAGSTIGKATRFPIAALSSASSTTSSSKITPSQINVITTDLNVGARLTVGAQEQPSSAASTPQPTSTVVANGGNLVRTPLKQPKRANSSSEKTSPSSSTAVYSPHSGAYNVEQATRQHHQQQQLLTRANNNFDEDEDDTTSYSVDQEADTHSQRSANDDTHDESSHADSELSESFRHQLYHRDVHVPVSKQQQLTNPSTRPHRGSPAPKQQFKQRELRLGDWL